MTLDERVELLNYLAFLHNKLIRLALKLVTLGEDPKPVDDACAQLEKEIRVMRAKIALQWQGDADSIIQQLRGLNEQGQTIIRELDRSADKVGKVAKVLTLIDKGLKLVRTTVL
jgi:hypothetical protein